MGKSTSKIDKMIASLQSAEASERAIALYGLGELGPSAIAALPDVRKLLQDDHDLVVMEAIAAVLKIDPGCLSELLPHVISALTDPEFHIRVVAAEILGDQGAAARSALPLLRLALEDDETVACSASVAIGQITGDYSEAIRLGVRLLDSRRWLQRVMGAELLRELGPIARPALPMLKQALGDRKKAVRRVVRAAMRAIQAAAAG